MIEAMENAPCNWLPGTTGELSAHPLRVGQGCQWKSLADNAIGTRATVTKVNIKCPFCILSNSFSVFN
jgi:hypothetical protein